MATLLLELFSEEIPARMQAWACDQLQSQLKAALAEAGYALDDDAVEGFVTPRRLAVRVEGLPEKQADVSIERKGPRTNAPQPAIDGFLRSTGLTLEQLEVRGDTYFATIEQKGRATAEALVPMIEGILNGFTWPKSMRWGSHSFAWVRPLKNILCLLDSAVLPVKFCDLEANNTTYGHRFLAPDAITLTDPDAYEDTLNAAFVIADADARKAMILEQAEEAASKAGRTLKADEGLLNEVTGLVEWPCVLVGRIDEAYMALPPEVLVSEMREHQRYFALHQADGSLAREFLITSNMHAPAMDDKGAAIIAGNERVLRARLADGRFFWEQDQKQSLDAWGAKLADVVFHAKLGTMQQKVARIAALAAQIAPLVGADVALTERAAHLCKCDLTTGMVGEFPDLQGVMGRYYALAQGENAAVADAIRDHYKPAGAADAVPTTPISIAVALADKLDTLAGFFSVGEKPTGSKDPFALRRAALGVIRIIRENGLSDISLSHVCQLALKLFNAGEPSFTDLIKFFDERLKVSLKDEGIAPDTFDAVRNTPEIGHYPLKISEVCHLLQAFRDTEAGTNLLSGYNRACNLLASEEKKSAQTFSEALDAENLASSEASTLNETIDSVRAAVKQFIYDKNYKNALEALATLRAPVDAFFVAVMVNDADATIRTARLQLLAKLRTTFRTIADFDKLQG